MRRTSRLGVRLATLALFIQIILMMTTASAQSLRSASSATGSGPATVEQLLANVQAAVRDDPALANMFDISNASEMSEEELTLLLRDLLSTSVLGAASASASASVTGSESESLEGSKDFRGSGSPAGPTEPSGALRSCSLSRIIAVVATGVALGVALV